jgi:PIN domain nuclease of toxin-antitoxin system
MNVLLDTHAFLWWIDNNPKLSSCASGIISDAGNAIFLSAVSGWEIAIKARLGKLMLPGDLERFIADQLAANAFSGLPIQLSHALHVYTLPAIHRDSFDRILVAQSQLEDMPILTADLQIARYPVEVIW